MKSFVIHLSAITCLLAISVSYWKAVMRKKRKKIVNDKDVYHVTKLQKNTNEYKKWYIVPSKNDKIQLIK